MYATNVGANVYFTFVSMCIYTCLVLENNILGDIHVYMYISHSTTYPGKISGYLSIHTYNFLNAAE